MMELHHLLSNIISLYELATLLPFLVTLYNAAILYCITTYIKKACNKPYNAYSANR